MIRVRVRAVSREGFFRAGQYWPGEWTTTEVEESTLTVLQREPWLVVEILKEKDTPANNPSSPIVRSTSGRFQRGTEKEHSNVKKEENMLSSESEERP